jgi:GNAT superfamily N-acetyltransferase
MMRILEVTDQATAQIFVQLPDDLYRKWPQYVGVPAAMVHQLFDPKYNQKAAQLEVKRWLLYQDERPIGRIAAFDHPKKAANDNAGALGFFVCINNASAAALLFETAENWLRNKGYDWVDGPLNLGENDQYWGLLTDGFERPSFGMNWNPPYLLAFFEAASYQPYYEQHTNFIDLRQGLPDRFHKIANYVAAKSKVQLAHFEPSRFDFFANAVVEVFNNAWSDFENFSPIDLAKVQNDFRRMRPILVDDLVWFAFVNEQPAAFLVMLPDLNEVLVRTGPMKNLWAKLKFVYYRRLTRFRRLKIVVMGVHQRYQNMGVESVLLQRAYEQVCHAHPHFEEVELAWVGDFNKKMLALHAAAGAAALRKHLTLRKSFENGVNVKKFEIKTA